MKTENLPLFNPGDSISLNTGYTCDKGIFIRYEDNSVVWRSNHGGEYKSPVTQYKITKIAADPPRQRRRKVLKKL